MPRKFKKSKGRKKFRSPFKKRRTNRKKRGGKGKTAVSRIIKEIKDVGSINTYSQAFSFLITAILNTGSAKFAMLAQWNDASDFDAMAALIQARSLPSTGMINKMVVGSFSGVYTMKNLTNVDLNGDMYHVIARRDLDLSQAPVNPVFAGSPITFSSVFSSMLEAYYEQTPGNLILDPNAWPYGLLPRQLHRFCVFFKIIKQKKFSLRGGETKTFTISDKKWRLIDDSLWSGSVGTPNGTYTQERGTTHSIFCIVKGQPMVVNESSGVVPGPVSIGLVTEESYKYGFVSQPMKLINPPITSFSGGTPGLGLLRTVNTGTQVVDTFHAAGTIYDGRQLDYTIGLPGSKPSQAIALPR